MAPTPTKDDRFTFGLWTVGWQGRDPFGDATRAPVDPVESVHQLAGLGASGSPSTTTTWSRSARRPRERDKHIARFKDALAETGMAVPMMTTNLFTHPVFKDGGFTSNDRSVRRYALRKVARNIDLAAELGAADLRVLGRPRGRGVRRRQGRRAPRSTATARASTRSPPTCMEQGYGIRFAIEPKPNEPRGDILLPTVGHALAFIAELEHARHGRAQPRGRARADGRAELHRRHRPGAVGRASCSTSTSTASARSSSTRTWSSATATCSTPSHLVDLLEHGARRRRPAVRPGRGTSTTSRRAPRTWPASGPPPRRTWRPTCCSRNAPPPTAPTPRCRRRWPTAGVATLRRADPRPGRDARRPARRPARFDDFDPDRPASTATASSGSTSSRSSTSWGARDRCTRLTGELRLSARRLDSGNELVSGYV